MSNHLHMIVEANEGVNISDILRDFKKYTSKEIVETIQEIPASRRSNPCSSRFVIWMKYGAEE